MPEREQDTNTNANRTEPLRDEGTATTMAPTTRDDELTTGAGRPPQPSGTDATGGASDTTTDYAGGKIRGG